MTVVNPKSISGINSITTGSGSDNLLTIHTSDANNTERVRVNSSGDVIIGSGVTLSPDGDVFATGVCTATSFSGDGSALTGISVSSDLVNDTSPQLGGNLDVNAKNILLGDSSDGSSDDVLIFGADSDLKIFHNSGEDQIQSTASRLEIRSDSLRLISSAAEKYFMGTSNGSAALYHDGTKQCETSANGLAFPSGKGIDFSATGGPTNGSGSSELLDDYEEGTFTPTARGNTTNSSPVIEGSGKYTKIGNMVHVQFDFSNENGSYLPTSEYFQIHGLPFTFNGQHFAPYGFNYNVAFLDQGTRQYLFYSPNGTTRLDGYFNVSDSPYQPWSTNDWNSTAWYHSNSFSYRTS